jgi:ribA/ribD-fused uncharacterized protein
MPIPVGSVAELAAAVAAGERVKFLFFWGHQPERDGSVGPGCLSQWWPCAFIVDGTRFATAEHYMMWRKALLFGDHATAEQILAAAHPHAAKTLGRKVTGFDQRRWDAHRYNIVVAANLAKFGQHEQLGAYLAATGGRILVEASPIDRVWGIGLTHDDPAATDPSRWPGLNLLGFALMQVRAQLPDQQPARG